MGSLRGHKEWIYSLAFLGDGKTLATVGGHFDLATQTSQRPGELKLWDLGTLKEQLSVTCSEVGTYSLALSPDGGTLATGDFAGVVRLWDVDALLRAARARETVNATTPGVLITPSGESGRVDQAAASTRGSAAKPERLSVKKIWAGGPHNAFTDLIAWKNRFWCVFREAEGHAKGNGVIRILVSNKGEKWESAATVKEQGLDLRDPKLSVTPDGRLMLATGGADWGGTTKVRSRQSRVAFFDDGRQWSGLQRILSEGDWLWRVTRHDGKAWGVAYRAPVADKRKKYTVALYSSDDGLEWKKVRELDVPGQPNETTLRSLSALTKERRAFISPGFS